MFAKPAEILKGREGKLADTPLPLLLHALLAEERSGTLELKVRALEKKIFFEDGSPVGCQSNLLHETLGKYLVEKKKVTEESYQKALLESVQTGARMGEILVKAQLISPFDLYKQLQANLAHKILDCFRWSDASYRLHSDAPESDTPVRMNTLQLILTGSSNFLPFDLVATHLAFADEQRFALVPNPPHPPNELKLSAKETRLLSLLRAQPTFGELGGKIQLETEELMRRLYAFCVLGLVDFADAIAQSTATAQPVAQPGALPAQPQTAVPLPPAIALAPHPPEHEEPAEPPKPPEPPSLPYGDEDPDLRNALMATFMEHRSKDPFALLGVDEKVQTLALRKAFLGALERFSPVRFRNAELKEKAEALAIAYARAFSTLVDPEQLALWQKRRAAAAEKKVSTRPSTAEQFRISTSLLDGGSQFAEGKKRLDQNNPRGAFEYFQHACDIEPRALHKAYLAWTRFQMDPARHARLALQELTEAGKQDPGCEWPFFFAAEIHRGRSEYEQAEEAYKKAYKANPQTRRYADLTHEMIRLRKTK